MSNDMVIAKLKRVAVSQEPDTDRYKFRFKVRSQSSDSLYLISFDNAPGAKYWVCSCRGCIGHGHCKHLDSIGLVGRAKAKMLPSGDRMAPRR
jgi:hypothetical protein